MIFKSTNGDIYYEIKGEENSKVIAFVHGMMMDNRMFENQIKYFAKNYKVLLWDMPQHGMSFKQKQDFEFSIAAESFIELLDELEIEKVILVGVSLGGWVTQFIANKYPDRVETVVIEGCTPLHVNLNKLVFIFSIYIFMFKLLPWFIIRKIFIKATDKMAIESDLKKIFIDIFNNLDKKTVIYLFRGIRKEIKKGLDKEIPHSVLVIYGEKELSLLKKSGKTWQKENPRIHYSEIQGAGHGSNTFKPVKFNEKLMDFLASNKFN